MIQRIQRVQQIKKLSPSAFADKLGVPRSTISHVLSGRNNPSLEFIQKILDSYPDIRTEWLVRGEGNMMKNVNTLFPEEENQQTLPSDITIQQEDILRESVRGQSAQDESILHQNAAQKEISAAGEVKKTSETPENTNIKKENSDLKPEIAVKNGKKTARILIIYTDGTFTEYLPS